MPQITIWAYVLFFKCFALPLNFVVFDVVHWEKVDSHHRQCMPQSLSATIPSLRTYALNERVWAGVHANVLPLYARRCTLLFLDSRDFHQMLLYTFSSSRSPEIVEFCILVHSVAFIQQFTVSLVLHVALYRRQWVEFFAHLVAPQTQEAAAHFLAWRNNDIIIINLFGISKHIKYQIQQRYTG